jgi:hypothetical protein
MHRLMTDVGASVAASAIMLVLTIGGAQILAATTSTSTDSEIQVSTTCLERPLLRSRDSRVRAVIQLCLTDGGIRPLVELADATPGSIYTTWMAFLVGPSGLQDGPCL